MDEYDNAVQHVYKSVILGKLTNAASAWCDHTPRRPGWQTACWGVCPPCCSGWSVPSRWPNVRQLVTN